MVVTLTSADPSMLIAPPTVTIPAGQSSATVALDTGTDGVSSGPQQVVLTAVADGLLTATLIFTVLDVDAADYPNPGGNFSSFEVSGNGRLELTPPTAGPLAGIAIFQARDNAEPMSLWRERQALIIDNQDA